MPKIINMGSSTFTLTGISTIWNASTNTETINAGTSTIKITDNSSSTKTFTGGTNTYCRVWFSPLYTRLSTGALILGSNTTFNILQVDNNKPLTVTFPASFTTTINQLAISGLSNARTILKSSSPGTQWSIYKPTGSLNTDYVDITDSIAVSSGAVYYAGSNSVLTNTTGWTLSDIPPTTIFGIDKLTGVNSLTM
jgi:hypothetical protein